MQQQLDSIVNFPVVPADTVGTTVELPQYYRESFFAKDTLLHPELTGGRSGVAGDPVPYTVRSDDTIGSLLFLCFILGIVTFSFSRHIIVQQLKDFFYYHHASDSDDASTPGMKFQLFLTLLTSLLLAISYYFYIDEYVSDTFILDEPYELIAIFFTVFTGYFLVKICTYSVVNTIFFDSKINQQWLWAFTFITSLEGIALLPAVILQVYVQFSMENMVYYFIFTILLTKILTFYKCWVIFFRQNSVFLQIILYLCALEIVPLLSLWGILVTITNELKVIF